MKKIINENTLKSIIKESLKNYLKESMDSDLSMGEETEGWTPDMDDMWDEFGNNNVHDTDGAFGVLAQGDDDDHVSRVAKSLRSTKFDTDVNMGEFEDEADEFASDDNAEYLHDKMFESVIKNAVNEALDNLKENDDYDCGWDKSKWCGDAKFHEKHSQKPNAGKPEKSSKKVDYDCGWDKSKWCGDAKFHEKHSQKANEGKAVKLTESKLKDIISEAVMKVLNESVEEGGFGNFMRRTFNSSSVNANANYVDRTYQNYLKKFNQIKGHLEPGQQRIIQRNLDGLSKLVQRARQGEKIGEQQVATFTNPINRYLGYGQDQRSSYMAKQNAPSQSQSYNNSRMDSYDTSDGISHFGNGDAYRA